VFFFFFFESFETFTYMSLFTSFYLQVLAKIMHIMYRNVQKESQISLG